LAVALFVFCCNLLESGLESLATANPAADLARFDLNPIDPTLDESRPALLCFIWPDQTVRFQQLAEVVEIGPPRARARRPLRRRPLAPDPFAEPRPGVWRPPFN
jgi:hypothetical protein